MVLKSGWLMHGMSNMCQVEARPTCWIVSGFKSCTSFGLLNGSFRPDHQIRKLRTYMRLRDNLVASHIEAVHHMQKALFEMNVQLTNVISDIMCARSLFTETGDTIITEEVRKFPSGK